MCICKSPMGSILFKNVIYVTQWKVNWFLYVLIAPVKYLCNCDFGKNRAVTIFCYLEKISVIELSWKISHTEAGKNVIDLSRQYTCLSQGEYSVKPAEVQVWPSHCTLCKLNCKLNDSINGTELTGRPVDKVNDLQLRPFK